MKGGIVHPQRAREVVFKILTQGKARYSFDHLTHPIDADAIFPTFVRIKHEWHFERRLFKCRHGRLACTR